ncbi:MAG TPA: TonB-dependent receptor [Vicinamibacterales bacterium]|nr:TonB-dependent receptor [Vicinamibacterales bacterium]
MTSSIRVRTWFVVLILAITGLMAFPAPARAQVGGSLSGTIKDPSGGVIPGVSVTAINTVLGTSFDTLTDGQGTYTFPKLPVGRYDLTMLLDGFKPQKRTGIQIDADAAVQINATLQIGEQSETVTVSVNAVRVDTVSTQLGDVVPATTMTSLSLNGRSYTDLFAIQPGVAPTTTIQSNSVIMAGVTGPVAPSGELNPGIVSVSGQRETANGFYVNGSDVQERMNGGTGVVPNLDSIEEFRLLTNNFDPEYGNYNGGIVNVVTKSGSDKYTGDVFEFFRNTGLDARNYFSPERAQFNQNQPGGTLGGPVLRGKLFFFGDYQATRTTQGIETGNVSVPSLLNRAGDFSDIADQLTGSVNGSNWANILSQRLGYGVTPGEPYYTAACQTTAQCVFPGAVIPQRAWSAPSQNLLQYMPAPNVGANVLSTGAFAQTVRDDKGSFRLDGNTRFGLMTGYYFLDDYRLDNPYPGQQGGANVPGFDALTLGRAQLFSFGDAKTFGLNTVNDFHASLTHNANNVGVPNGGAGVSLASQGFVTGPGTPGIVVLAPQFEGVENLVFNTFTMGVTITGVNQTGDTLHLSDSLSHVWGSHTVKLGGQYQFAQVRLEPNATFNGTFTFAGTETGSDFADYLLGIPSNYIQSSGGVFYLRNQYGGVFAQDSWRVRPNVTFNYGVRWDIMAPWYEKNNQIQTVVPGQQSQIYPDAPLGLVFPGDPGIARGLSPTQWGNISPRLGIAYSPNEKTSIRASWGLFYTAFQGLSAGIMYGVPPYGYNYLRPAPPLFQTPFITAADGTNNGQRFPQQFPPLNGSPSNPVRGIDWSQFLPVNADPFFAADNKTPYSSNFMFSVQRELAPNMVLTASYVGTRGHNMLVIQQANPGDPALCLSVSQPSQVAPGSPTCGPFGENGVYTRADGTVINSTRTVLGPNYGTMTAQRSIGYSRYNGLELNLHYTKGRASVLAGYTYSKSVDVASNLGEQVNPFNVALSEAPSAFDMRHNFVVSYNYELPLETWLKHNNGWTTGWSLAGTTRLSSGFPVTLYNPTDTSLLGTFGNGVNNNLLDTPNYAAGCALNVNHDPSKGPAFNTGCFSLPALGQLGNAPRRFFYGPGIENFDIALIKRVKFDDTRNLEIRLEAFNLFNQPQFYGAGAVDGNIVSPTFGNIVAAAAPRFIQLAAKFYF